MLEPEKESSNKWQNLSSLLLDLAYQNQLACSAKARLAPLGVQTIQPLPHAQCKWTLGLVVPKEEARRSSGTSWFQ